MREAEQLVIMLLEGEDDDPKDWIDANLDDVLGDEEDESSHFFISVVPCVEHEGATYQLVDMPPGTEPQFWTVYKRIYSPGRDGEYEPGLEFALNDFNTPDEANRYANRLKELYRAEGKLVDDVTEAEEDPKDYLLGPEGNQIAADIRLDDYFGGGDTHTVETRMPGREEIAAWFSVTWKNSERTNETPYIGVTWAIENTDSYADLGRGGFGQYVPLYSMADRDAFIADLNALEKAVTVDFKRRQAQELTSAIGHRIYYGGKNGYSTVQPPAPQRRRRI